MPHPFGRPRRGFTLFEMVVVIGIVAVISATLIPVIIKPYLGQRSKNTLEEMSAIQEAILGRPDLGDWGFIGTMGRLPNDVSELLANTASVSVANFSLAGVLTGWNGPYLRASSLHPLLDGWGLAYQVDTQSDGTWRVRSAGPNGIFNDGDDIVIPPHDTWFHSRGALRVEFQFVREGGPTVAVQDTDIQNVRLWYPDGNGGEACTGENIGTCPGSCVVSGGGCNFSNTSLPFGMLVLEVNLDPATTNCGGACQYFRRVTVRQPATVATVALPAPPQTWVITGSWPIGPVTAPAGTTYYTTDPILIGQPSLLTVHANGAWFAPSAVTCQARVVLNSDPNSNLARVSRAQSGWSVLSSSTVFDVDVPGFVTLGLEVEATADCNIGDATMLTWSAVPR